MAEVIGVRFKNMGKVYYFDPNSEKLSADDHVVVETARGVEWRWPTAMLRMIPLCSRSKK